MKGEKKKNKKINIELKTDLVDLNINDNVRKRKIDISEIIINKENHYKIKFLNLNFNPSVFQKKKITKTNSSININLNDFEKFDKKLLKSNKSFLTSNPINEPITKLLDCNYNNYINKIKKLYSHFKRNHRNYKNNILYFSNEEYQQTNFYKNIIQENKDFIIEEDKYKINDKYLEKTKEELEEIIKFFDKKVGNIENELTYILFHSDCLINFIVKYSFIENNIIKLNEIFEEKKKKKNEIKKNFIKNNTKLFLLKTKIQNLKNLKYISNIILNFHQKVKLIKYTLSIEQERNSIVNIQKELIPIKKKYKNKIKLISFIENEMINLTEISESKYINSFIIYIDEIMKLCFSNFTIKNSLEKVKLNNNFNLSSSKKYENECFKYINNNNEEITFYHLKNLPRETKEKILSLLEIYSFIISQNFDITQIQEKLKNIFFVIIQEICDKITVKEILFKLKIEGIAFIFLKENFEYLIELFVNNFGTSPKIFKEIINYIINESKNIIIHLLIQIIEENVSLLPNLFYERKKTIISQMQNYFSLINFDYNKFFIQYENDLIFKFFTSQNDLIEKLIEKEEWIQINNFDIKYQFITNIISIDYNKITEKDLIINLSDNNKINYIECRNEKYKLINITLFILDFIYQVYYIILNKNEVQTIILQLVKILNNFTLKCNLLIIEGNGKIGKEKRIITEKEYILLNSNLTFIQSILFNINSFIIGDNDDIIINLINKHIKKINLIHLKCFEIINAILDQLKIDIISKFEKLNFLNYPILEIQGYNDFVIRFIKFQDIYNNMLFAFSDNDIVNIFQNIFDNFFDEFNEKFFNKSNFGNENMINQFKKDLNYIKEIIKKFELIKNNNYLEKIDNLINISKIENKFNEDDLIQINDIINENEEKKIQKIIENHNQKVEENYSLKKEEKNQNQKEKKKINKIFNKLNKFTGQIIKNIKKQDKEELKTKEMENMNEEKPENKINQINNNLIDLNFNNEKETNENPNNTNINNNNNNIINNELLVIFNDNNKNNKLIDYDSPKNENLNLELLKNNEKTQNLNNVNLFNSNTLNQLINTQQSNNSNESIESATQNMNLILYNL